MPGGAKTSHQALLCYPSLTPLCSCIPLPLLLIPSTALDTRSPGCPRLWSHGVLPWSWSLLREHPLHLLHLFLKQFTSLLTWAGIISSGPHVPFSDMPSSDLFPPTWPSSTALSLCNTFKNMLNPWSISQCQSLQNPAASTKNYL